MRLPLRSSRLRAWLSHALLALVLPGGAALGADRPNVVFLLADDLGYGDVRCLNPQGKIPTPHLDRLAAAGMLFTDAHSSSAVCTPTRYGVLTGRYNWRSRLKSGVMGGMSPPLIFDGGHRIPLIARWPGRIPAGGTSDQLVCLNDLFATCADILGLKLPENTAEDSVSLLPVLEGRAQGPVREALVHHSINGSFAIRQGRWKLELCADSGGWSAPRPGGSAASNLPPVQLYDLALDPGETHNVHAAQPEVVGRLTRLLERYVATGRTTPGPAQSNTTPVLTQPAPLRTLTLQRTDHLLVIRGPHLPGEVSINYLEAYCRAGSTEADWVKHTLIPHTNELISMSADAKTLRLRDTLADGVIVDHTIVAGDDEVDFRLVAHNPGTMRSEAHWAQPCVRLSAFMGFDPATAGNATDYLSHTFIFLDGALTLLPTRNWITEGRYVPGQTWCPLHVPRSDVNPRPLSPLVPDNGLIGAFSADEKMIFATAWEPYQELFQGVIRCLHSDFRLGGLKPGERKEIHGKIYLVPGDATALLQRYHRDFPEQGRAPR